MAKKSAKRRIKKASKKATFSKKVVRKAAKKVPKAPKKAVVRKISKKAVKAARKPVPLKISVATEPKAAPQKLVGEITHFYPQINVGVVALKSELKLGDTIVISGHGYNFEQKVYSMQLEHQPLSVAKKGQIIGMKVAQPVKEKDLVYKK